MHIFMFCPTSFFSNQFKFLNSKEICRAKHKYMNIHPPFNVLVTSLFVGHIDGCIITRDVTAAILAY